MSRENLTKTGAALLEIGTEELPAGFVYEALPQLESLAAKQLTRNRLNYEKISACGTPRRLVLEITKLSARQPDNKKEVRGPAKASAYNADGQPTPALLGFLKGQSAVLDSVQIKDFGDKPYVVVQVEEKGEPTPQILSSLFPEIISGLTFPKSMRWNGNFLFGRPIRWILALFEKKVVPFELAGLKSGSITFGLRSYSKGPISIPHPDQYLALLQKHYVVAHHLHRLELIRSQVEAQAQSKSGSAYRLDSILNEVSMLVEYPMAFLGSFDPRFLSLPEEVLVTVMQRHQRYFPVVDTQGKLLPYFVGVRNGKDEGLEEIRFGNEQVTRARFKDAEYFFRTDRKTKLEDRFNSLGNLIFQKNLGTIKQKVERLEKPCVWILQQYKLDDRIKENDLRQAIKLCKCDLATQMVFELPELQGVIGKEYAKLEGYSETVSQAILDHYLPRHPEDKLPEGWTGAIIGIADRVDTLMGCFSQNLKPTGSSDPLGLRRSAYTLLQILLGKSLDFNLMDLFARAAEEYGHSGFSISPALQNPTMGQLREFMLERMEPLWKKAGIRYDLIRALGELSLKWPASAFKRAQFLDGVRGKNKEKFISFVTAWVRVFNILKSKEAAQLLTELANPKKPEVEKLQEEEEKNLAELYFKLEPELRKALSSNELERTWKTLSEFEGPINLFFDKVLVMAKEPELKKERLNLLWNLERLMLDSFGDLTQIVLD